MPFKDIAAVIGRHLNVPVVSKSSEEAVGHFGWFAPASSGRTRAMLGWAPEQPGLISDIDRPSCFAA